MSMLKIQKKALAATAMAGTLFASTQAQAATIVYLAQLTGASEIPAVTTAGFGSAVFTLDDVARTLRIQVNFTGLTGNLTIAHIHCCAVQPANVGVATTTPTLPGFPAGATFGTYDNTLNLNLATSYNPVFITNNGGTPASAYTALISGINSGRSYLNLHSSFAPGGEIRGTLVALVPEPSTWLSMIFGFGLLGAAMRRPAVKTRVRYT